MSEAIASSALSACSEASLYESGVPAAGVSLGTALLLFRLVIIVISMLGAHCRLRLPVVHGRGSTAIDLARWVSQPRGCVPDLTRRFELHTHYSLFVFLRRRATKKVPISLFILRSSVSVLFLLSYRVIGYRGQKHTNRS